MEFEIEGNPDYGDLTVVLSPGEKLLVESGAMSRMSANMGTRSRLMGGFVKAMFRKMFGGESLFVGEYTHPQGGMVSLSPAIPGSVLHLPMKHGREVLLEGGAFLACSPGVRISTRFGGLKALFSGEGAFFLHAAGEGDLFFNAYGGVVEKEIDGALTVDTGHVVAWETTLDWKIGGMGSLKSTLFSGEGLVLKFTGKGKIWLQTRTLDGMAGWLRGYCR